MPVWALDAATVDGPLGVRTAAPGERLGEGELAPTCPPGGSSWPTPAARWPCSSATSRPSACRAGARRRCACSRWGWPAFPRSTSRRRCGPAPKRSSTRPGAGRIRAEEVHPRAATAIRLSTAVPAGVPAADEAIARRELRRQVADLERRLSRRRAVGVPRRPRVVELPGERPRRRRGARLLELGELESLRDDLAARLARAQARLAEVGERQEAARVRLERMLREPGRHRFARVANAELGEGGCGVWQVRPRLGLVGVLAGWWEVKLSSGCPRPGRPAAA